MKKLLTSIMVLFSITTSFSTNIGGVLTGNTTLSSSGNPYIVTSDLQVPNGTTLTILPGVNLFFQKDISLKVAGTLRAEGSGSQPITMTRDASAAPYGWKGIVFYTNATNYDTLTGQGCILKNCKINFVGPQYTTYDIYNVSDGMPIKALFSTIMIDSCELTNNGNNFIYLLYEGSYIYNTYINNGGIAHWVPSTKVMVVKGCTFNNSIISGTGKAIIKNNTFMNHVAGQYDFMLIRVGENCEITNNQFINNPGSIAIAVLGGYNHTITNNYFSNNKTNVGILCQRNIVLEHNCFANYISYNIEVSADVNRYSPVGEYDCYNNSNSNTYTYNFANNSFNGLTNSQIDASIYDMNDNVAEFYNVNYLPISTAELTGCFNTATGINDLINENEISVFPNPSNGIFNFSGVNKNCSVKIINLLGEVVVDKNDTESNTSIDLSGQSKGVYFYQLFSENKLLKQGKLILN